MGIYLNPDNENFKISLNGKIYVDKTEMIPFVNSLVNTPQRYLCVSRPRRFGKTMAVDMLCAYYSCGADSRSLFEHLKLSQSSDWDSLLGKFNVIRITMLKFLSGTKSVEEMIDYLNEEIIAELKAAFPKVPLGTRQNLPDVLERIFAKTKQKFVVFIDEWDAIFREYKNDQHAQKDYLDFLRDWFKDQPSIALAYMTGILPVKKYGKHSALNMFDEYSMTEPMQLARFTGFTEEEVKMLCAEFGMDFDKIREWYDGYRVDDASPADDDFRASTAPDKTRPPAKKYHLYSPLSVVKAMMTGHIQNYWNKTETYEALAEYIRMDFDGLKETVAKLMSAKQVHVDLGSYQNDMTTFTGRDDILALLIHLGYLGYDMETGNVFIPNNEILDEYRVSTKGPEWSSTMRALRNSQELLEATWAGNETRVAELLEEAHDKVGNRTYNSEAALSYAVQLAYYKAQDEYTVVPEVDSGKGYADLLYLPKNTNRPALLIELKYNQDATSAIDQILKRNYPDRLQHYKGNLILVGISYVNTATPETPNFKHHHCRLLRA